MIVIAADVGNSATKIVFRSPGDSAETSPQIQLHESRLDDVALPDAAALWSICSVNSQNCQQLSDWIRKHRPRDQVHEIDESEIPIRSNIVSRATTGRDRLVAAWQACRISTYSERAKIVVDAGTAVTIDWIDNNQVYQGGSIFPGATACLSYLSAGTDALPDLSVYQRKLEIGEIMADVIGRDTQMAILRGVFHSQLVSMERIVESIRSRHDGNCDVVATGGGVQRLADYLPRDWQIVPELVVQGALEIGQNLLSNLNSDS